jgi:RNA polymerase sigma-70 factor, ECF subfamily
MRKTKSGHTRTPTTKNSCPTHYSQFKRKRFKNMLANIPDRIDENAEALVPDDILLQTEDGALVAAAKNGSIGALDVLVEHHQGRILRIVQRVTRNREDAEDVVQQSFQKAFGHLHKFEERSSFSTWLTRIAINEAIMCMRSRRARTVSVDVLTPNKEAALTTLEIPDPSASPETSCAQRETERFLFLAINLLTPGVRTAIQLCDLDEHSLKESAHMMGVSVAAVKSRVSRGRRELRRALKRLVTPAARFEWKSFDGGATNGPRSSNVRFVKPTSDGGCHSDDLLGNCAGGFGPPLPDWARKWRRITSSSLNRVRDARGPNPIKSARQA